MTNGIRQFYAGGASTSLSFPHLEVGKNFLVAAALIACSVNAKAEASCRCFVT
jgi:hypothetical protein